MRKTGKTIVSLVLAIVLFFGAAESPLVKNSSLVVEAQSELTLKVSRVYSVECTKVTLTGTKGYDLRYTTDGTSPTVKSTLYNGKTLKFPTHTVIKMALFDSNGTKVKTAKATIDLKCLKVRYTISKNEVSLMSYTPDVKIYYTTDGTTPSNTNGTLYKKPFKLDEKCTVKAVAIKSGYIRSSVTSKAITISAGTSSSANAETDTDKDDFCGEVLKLVNDIRVANGLTKFTTIDALDSAAQKRAEEICGKFSHTRPDGSSASSITEDYGISWNRFGENIAAGQLTPQDVVDNWMKSPGHRANILNPSFNKLGVGYAIDNNATYKYYWAQIFTN